jgi:hypothetical protein
LYAFIASDWVFVSEAGSLAAQEDKPKGAIAPAMRKIAAKPAPIRHTLGVVILTLSPLAYMTAVFAHR